MAVSLMITAEMPQRLKTTNIVAIVLTVFLVMS